MQKTNFPIEIIIHDDASTDNSGNIIREYEKQYPDIIKPIYQNINQYSIEKVRILNIVHNAALGKYIAYCEGDDYWTDPLKLQKQVDFLEANPDYGLVHTNFDRFYQINNRLQQNVNATLKTKYMYYKTPFYGILTGDYRITTATVLARTTLVKNAILAKISKNPNNKQGDLPMWLEILNNSKVKYLPDSTAVYRIIQNSASHQTSIFNIIKYQESSKRIRLYFAKKYKVPKEILAKVENMYYRVMLDKAYYFKDKELAIESYKKLKGNRNIVITSKYLATRNDFFFQFINTLRIVRRRVNQFGKFKEY